MKKILTLFFIAVQTISCVPTWNSRAQFKKHYCVKIINGSYFHVEDCQYWGHIPSSDGNPLLPP